jgi:DeoR/GlpR family transcriptional regulator of sugar metabolism
LFLIDSPGESAQPSDQREGQMHETERHRIILSAVQDRPVVTVIDLCNMTGASEATIRRDIATLDAQKKLRRVRGGAESINPPQLVGLAGRPSLCRRGALRGW